MKRLAWLIVPIIGTLLVVQINADSLPLWVIGLPLLLVWLSAIVRLVPSTATPLRWLLHVPALLWAIALLAFSLVIAGWITVFQPAVGITMRSAELYYLIGSAYGLVMLLVAAVRDSAHKRAIGFWSGPLLTLTTLILIVFAVELGLRYWLVMSDNFAFSKMHQNWTRLYWQPVNELGYRDNAPASEAQINVMVAGDSLVTGYGINSIEDTFPQRLDDLLEDEYSVNIVAQPGWGISTAMDLLQDYPVQPDILVLSHFINDIVEGPAGQQYRQPFPQIRLEPTPNQEWWVNNWYIGNFLFYRVFLYTAHQSPALYNDWINSAYEDPAVWAAYQQEIQAVIDYATEKNVQLIVLVWPNLLDIEGTQAQTQPVIQFFVEQAVPLVDMSQYLREYSVSQRIVNTFDAHPSRLSHQIAAEQLFTIVQNMGR